MVLDAQNTLTKTDQTSGFTKGPEFKSSLKPKEYSKEFHEQISTDSQKKNVHSSMQRKQRS